MRRFYLMQALCSNTQTSLLFIMLGEYLSCPNKDVLLHLVKFCSLHTYVLFWPIPTHSPRQSIPSVNRGRFSAQLLQANANSFNTTLPRWNSTHPVHQRAECESDKTSGYIWSTLTGLQKCNGWRVVPMEASRGRSLWVRNKTAVMIL